MKILKNKTTGFYIGLVAAVLAIISSLIFTITNSSDRTFSIITVIFMVLGALAQLFNIFFDYKFSPIIPAILYSVGVSMHFNVGLETLSDVWNGVNYIGGNANAVIIYGILFMIVTIAAIVTSFMEQRKTLD